MALDTGALLRTHREGDEQIYLSLARNLRATGRYTLQGTPILPRLSQGIYDRPFFHHPPLFVLAIQPFVAAGWEEGSVVVSLAAHLTLIGIVVALLRRWRRGPNLGCQPARAASADHPLGWSLAAAAVGVATDPLLVFTSQKIWIEPLLSALSAGAMALALVGLDSPRRAWWLASGAVLGLAMLAKLPAVACVPALLVAAGVAARRDGVWRPAGDLAIAFGMAILVVLPWFLAFHAHYGVLLPDWTQPDAEMLASNRLMRIVTDRPATYFLKEILLLNPLIAVLVVAAVARRRWPTGREAVLWTWFWGAVALFTVLGMGGHTYQMRFLALASAPLYLLLGLRLARPSSPALRVAAGAALAWNAATAVFLATHWRMGDAYSLVEILMAELGL